MAVVPGTILEDNLLSHIRISLLLHESINYQIKNTFYTQNLELLKLSKNFRLWLPLKESKDLSIGYSYLELSLH